ncbi:MAG: sugar phosphate isomerase/epimerase family protein [Halodesulfurarchaeum sp.]
MSLRERIGVDLGTEYSILGAVEWAAEHDVQYVDVNLDETDLDPGTYDEAVAGEIRSICDNHDVHLGLHTLSSVNVAETSPIVGDAVEEYHRAYVDIAERVGAEWIVVHGGYHQSYGFDPGVDARIETAVDRLSSIASYADGTGVRVLLENHNKEPPDAEMHYIPATLAETKQYFSALPEAVGWAFNPPHANLQPEGISGFIDALDVDRCGEVRLNDNRGDVEEHLPLGAGTIDFESLVTRLETEAGYEGHYTIAVGSPDEMLEDREYLLELADAE